MCVESAEYLLDLRPMLLNLTLVVVFNARHTRPPLESPLDLAHDPGVGRSESKWGRGQWTHLSKSPSAVVIDLLRLSILFLWITVFSTSHTSKQYSDSSTEYESSIISSCWVANDMIPVRRWSKSESTNPNQGSDSTTALKICFTGAGGVSAALLFRISILLSKSDALDSGARVAIITGLA